VPADATWAVLRMWTRDAERGGRFLVHTMQLLPRRSCRSHETQKMLSLTAEAPTVLPFQLTVSHCYLLLFFLVLSLILSPFLRSCFSFSLVLSYSVSFLWSCLLFSIFFWSFLL
jgi:hypothetical protein